jgi:LEA14-like dessication related protein
VKHLGIFVAALLVGCLAFGCNRPKPPTITPEKGELTSIGADGVHLMLHLRVENPNGFDLSARSATGRVLLERKYEVGTFTLAQPFRLPAGQASRVSVPTTLVLRDVPALLGLAASNRDLTYDADGTVNVGGDSINVNLPFHLSGEITHEQLLRATMNSLPRFP